MKTAESFDGNVIAKDLGHKVLRFGKTIFDGKLGLHVPHKSTSVGIKDYASFLTKKEAVEFCRANSWPQNHISKFGNRWGSYWGIRNDFRDTFFLLN